MFEMKLALDFKTSYDISMSADEKWLCHTLNNRVDIIDIENKEKIQQINRVKHPSMARFYENLLLVNNTSGNIYIFERGDYQLIKRRTSTKFVKRQEGEFLLMNETLVDIVINNNEFEMSLMNLDTFSEQSIKIKQLCSEEFDRVRISHCDITVDKIFLTAFNFNAHYKIIEITGLAETRILTNPLIRRWHNFVYNPSTKQYVFLVDHEIIVLDSNFKQVIQRHLLDNFNYCVDLSLSNDYKYLVLCDPKTTYVFTSDNLNLVTTLSVEYCCYSRFSNSDQYLMVGSWNKGYLYALA
ncbi:hypothetical protein SY83_04655 [Paenibacillus swuensis]|uniref:Uncharacterized protein n=1 Tax=Paenibacillus swuensis TaxID=1178515 RepID=A0A172TFQ3_9BACL|nr:hypothetical protein [Paenibacillus swuensis]ANE45707.1 hypothetical protein SY83_04655 [Paenibacillus swuensis]